MEKTTLLTISKHFRAFLQLSMPATQAFEALLFYMIWLAVPHCITKDPYQSSSFWGLVTCETEKRI